MEAKVAKVDINSLVMTDNPRLPTNMDIDTLAENIISIGLIEPIHVRQKSKGILEVLRGHRRSEAMMKIADETPEIFAKLFPDGINAVIWENVSDAEAVVLKLDHGAQVSLVDPHELQMSANMMFVNDYTEGATANQLKPLIMKISPMSAKNKAKVKALEEDVEKAKNGTDRAVAQKVLEDWIANHYRGRVQNLHNVFRCPKVVNAALYYHATGETVYPKDVPEGLDLPKLTNGDIKALWKAHKSDMEEMDEKTGAPLYNKETVGPKFKAKWMELVEAVDAPTTPKQKAMSANDMNKECTDGKWLSVGFYKLTKRHTGDKTVEGLEALDIEYRAIDLIKEHTPELYEAVMTEASKLKNELAEPVVDTEKTEG